MKPYLAFAFFVSVILILIGLSASAAPFVTPGMMKRNGLTDEQYAHLWALGKNPRVDQATMRDWYFKSHRYPNVTNWLEVCGRTNDFAKLSYKLQDDNFVLEDTNKVLKAENGELWRTNAIVVAENEILVETNAVIVAQNEILVATNAVLEVDAKKAQKVEKAAAKAKKKDTKNFQKWVSDTEKAKSKSSEDMAEFYDSVLELAHAYEEAN